MPLSATSKNSGAWDAILGPNNPDRVQSNDNGERMLKWCLRHNMKIMNSWFRTKRIQRNLATRSHRKMEKDRLHLHHLMVGNVHTFMLCIHKRLTSM